MAYEIYFVPNDPVHKIDWYPLLPGKAIQIYSLVDETVYGIGVASAPDDSKAIVYGKKLGKIGQELKKKPGFLFRPENRLRRADHQKKVVIPIDNENGTPGKLLIRHAGKTALHPNLN